ncbi:MAG: type II protein secretion system D protein [Epsilonproteobacteria bacterium]|nr:type II protein secretion system D protein [Campylobacterota bacterium]NPA89166.1 type II protein secretion system D protein [Campylobacterota bacterium]
MKRVVVALLLIVGVVWGSCSNRLFSYTNSLNPENRTTIREFLAYLATGKCGINVVYTDTQAEKKVDQKMPFVKIKDMTLRQILDLILAKRGLFYTLNGNTLEVSYYKTKTYKLDWIAMSRQGSNMVSTSSNSGGGGETGGTGGNAPTSGGTSTLEGSTVKSQFKSDLWSKIKKDVTALLRNNSPDPLNAKTPEVVIDKTAGLVTVTGTKRQLDAVDRYIKTLVKRLTKEVLIDVKILSVNLSESHQTGINWSTLQISSSGSTSLALRNVFGSNSIFKSGSKFTEEALLNFLAKYGNVNSISNPKIVTLNNQKAIVTVGDTVYYKYPNKSTTTDNGTTQVSYVVGSKFVGVILDITPQISDDGTIILNVYPRISSFVNPEDVYNNTLDRPPNTSDKTISTVVRLKDGQTLVMGGLILNDKSFTRNGVPILKEIPILNFFFSYKEKISNKKELVFIITPHIIKLNEKKTLRDLGFGGF